MNHFRSFSKAIRQAIIKLAGGHYVKVIRNKYFTKSAAGRENDKKILDNDAKEVIPSALSASAKAEASVIIMSSLVMSQVQKATVAAKVVCYDPYDPKRNPAGPPVNEYDSISGRSKVKVIAELTPLSSGLLMMRAAYSATVHPF